MTAYSGRKRGTEVDKKIASLIVERVTKREALFNWAKVDCLIVLDLIYVIQISMI
jgi:hypothetical protein